jgi:hypothetical protein
MATNRTFQTMLNEYLPNKLLKEELVKRDYILSTCKKDDSWKGGKLIVPFKAAGGSSIRMGGLTAGNDISEDLYVRGSIDDYVEAWGSMIFNHRDLMEHDGKIPETTFLKILPDSLEDFMDYMKMVTSVQLGTGPHFATLTANGTVGGLLTVDRIDRFVINQKITLKGDVAAAADFYVLSIDVNANTVTVSATRGGAAADVSAYTTADNAKVFTDDADDVSFLSARSALLSAANGGSATIHGQTKTAYPFLQAVNIDGSSWTKANILDKLFDGYNQVRKKAKGNAREILMSYTVGAAVMAAVENKANGQASWNVQVMDKKASIYGWDEIMITSVKGRLKIVMIQEWDDDVVWYRDPDSHTFRSNGFFKKRKNPEGHEYFELRNQDGYQYIVDMCLFGEMEYTKPGQNGFVYGIDPANFAL